MNKDEQEGGDGLPGHKMDPADILMDEPDEIEDNAHNVQQQRASRPSDDNQRHSNKVEQIVMNLNQRDDLGVSQQKNAPVDAQNNLQAIQQEESAFSDAIFQQKSDDPMPNDANDIPQYIYKMNEVEMPSMHQQYAQKISTTVDEFGSMVQGARNAPGLHHQDPQQIDSDLGQLGAEEQDPAGPFNVGRRQNLDYDQAEELELSRPDPEDYPQEVLDHQRPHPRDYPDINIGHSLFGDDGGATGQEQAALAADSAAQNDKRFYTLVEIAEMEPMFERKYYDEKNATSAHVILSPQEYRAKLYWLDSENRWKDIGTGRFRLLLSKDGEEHYIQVVSEDCIDEQLPMDDVEKVVDSVIGQQDNAQSPPSNGANHHLDPAASAPKQVFLHRCFVNSLYEFSRQGDTIITWSDDYKNEFALSFQDEKGAQNTWWSICFLKGIQISANLDEHNEAGGSSDSNSITGSGVVLPTKENLTDLVNDLYSTDAYVRRNIADAVLRQEENHHQRATNGSSIESDRDHGKLQTWRSLYLDKLQKIFSEVEAQYQKAVKAMEDGEGDEHDRYIHMQQQVNHLHSLFQIFRNLLNLNQSELLEVLLNENYWMTTFGALEYDPEVFSPLGYKYGNEGGQGGGAHSPVGSLIKPPKRGIFSQQSISSPNSMARDYGSYDHFEQNNQYGSLLAQEADFREFLSNKVKYKQAVDITDPQVTYSIHLSYKLQYLKDTAMARFIDENTSHTIMQLVSSLHNIILDYIFGDDFERIQAQLIAQMRDNSNVEDKENALKFFLEICSLLKSTNLTNRQLQNCTNAFTKIMKVLAQIFDIMIPDKHTLLAEVKGDTNYLVKIFEARSREDIEKAALARTSTAQAREASAEPAPNSQHENQEGAAPEESKDSSIAVQQLDTPEKAQVVDGNVSQSVNDEFIGPSTPAAASTMVANIENQDCSINPGRATLDEYLKNPLHSEDPSMTQIDTLKSNSIEIFYNLLILLNNVNHSTIRDFLCSEHQKKHNFVFLRHLAEHMMYSSQQGIKVSICEFFKDLTSKETTEMQKTFQTTILHQVVALFVDFLGQDDQADAVGEPYELAKLRGAASGGGAGPREEGAAEQVDQGGDAEMAMKDEELKSQESRQAVDPKIAAAFKKKIDQSRILILQFMNKLIADNVDSYALRTFFFEKKVLLKVANCSAFKSIQTNVEVVKFFKAIIQTKDNMCVKYMINKQIFETILDIFLTNKTKGNLLHSCILNLFEMLTPAEPQQGLIAVIDLDRGAGAPRTEGGYVQPNLLNKLYQKLNENKYVKRVFFNKKYEDGFRKFNRHLRQVLDIQYSEIDSKLSNDIHSNSQSQQKMSGTNMSGMQQQSIITTHNKNPLQQKTERDYENELDDRCFPDIQQPVNPYDNNEHYQPQQPHESRSPLSPHSGESPQQNQPGQGSRLSGSHMHHHQQQQQYAREDQDGNIAYNSGARQDNANDPLYLSDEDVDIGHNKRTGADGEVNGEERRVGGSDEEGEEHKTQYIKKNLPSGEDIIMAGNDDGADKDGMEEHLDVQGGKSKQDQTGSALQVEPSLPRRRSQDSANTSIRVARSQSPLSGHAIHNMARYNSQGALMRQLTDQEKSEPIDLFGKNLEGAQKIETRPRKLSQEDVGLQQYGRQGSGQSNKLLNLSDEANGSNRGANKSVFSDTISNPDLDEIFFNKPKPGQQQETSGFTLQIQSPNTTSPGLRVQKQASPGEPLQQPLSQQTSEVGGLTNPFKKSKGEKKHGMRQPKYDRGARRASSENPPARSEFTNLSGEIVQWLDQKGREDDEADADMLRLLDSKLTDDIQPGSLQPQTMKHFKSQLQMRRNESIDYGAAVNRAESSQDFAAAVGQKRQRQSQDREKESESDEFEDLIKENWVNKRPRLAEKQEEDAAQQESRAKPEANREDDSMANEQDDTSALQRFLDASFQPGEQKLANNENEDQSNGDAH